MLWIADRNQRRAVRRLNAELSRIYSWSIFNTVVFEPTKFHLLDVGRITISDKWRDRVMFESIQPDWCPEAPYLGVILDEQLTMIPCTLSTRYHFSTTVLPHTTILPLMSPSSAASATLHSLHNLGSLLNCHIPELLTVYEPVTRPHNILPTFPCVELVAELTLTHRLL